jgi:hypothetical protein
MASVLSKAGQKTRILSKRFGGFSVSPQALSKALE